MRKSIALSLIISFVFLSSCASIIHGAYQDVTFSSSPSGAKIFVDGVNLGTTPKTVELRRKGYRKDDLVKKKEYQVKIEMPGYFPYEVSIKREMDTWFLGNIIFGGIIGIIIDAANGAMYKLTPDQIIAQMAKDNQQAKLSSDDDALSIFVTLEVDPSWEKIGQLQVK